MAQDGPSWDEAIERREALLFQNEEEGDGSKPGARKKWRTFEWPDTIQNQSSGLGLYFKTLCYFLIVSTLMSLVGIWPLVTNYLADEFTDTYTLVEADAEPQTCDRNYEVGGSILETSLGNWCGKRDDMSQSFASKFDCAASCSYPSSSVNTLSPLGLCTGDEGEALLVESSCDSRRPCPSKCSSTDSDSLTRTERIQCCNCCDLAVDVDQLGGTPLWQAWLWCTVGTIVWVVWMRMLKRMQDRASADYNVKNVTCADFSVWVSNLPSDADKDSELRKFAEHYGEVVAAFHIRRMGNVLNLNNRLEDAELHLAETKALSDSSGGFLNTLYRMYVCGFSSADSAAEKLEASIKEMKEKLKAQQDLDLGKSKNQRENAQEFKPTGNAIVVFKYSRHKRNMTEDHMRSNTFADLLMTPAIHRQFDVLFRGWFSGAPRFQIKDNSGIPLNGGVENPEETTCFTRPPGHFIRVQRAPEPDEIWWENTMSRFPYIWLRRGASWAGYFALIAISCALQLWITLVAEEERERRLDAGRATDESAASAASDSTGLIVTGLNIAVLPIIKFLATWERHQTTTSYLTVMVFKLTVFYFLNSFAVPIWAYSISVDPQSWFTPGGIAESAFYIQLVNTFLPDLLSVVDLPPMFSYHVLSKFARTQDYLNAAIQPRTFDIPLRFASAIKTVALGVLWAPALPISPMLSLIGIAISYGSDQFVALHRCRKPQAFDVEALNIVNATVLDTLPLVQMLIIYFIYFADDGNALLIAAFAVGVILWGIAFLAPIDFLFASTRNKNVEPDGSDRYSFDAMWSLGPPGTSTNHSGKFVLGSDQQKAIDDIRVVDDNKFLRPKFYVPMLPSKHLSSEWAKAITDAFDISKSGPNRDARLRGQQARYGAPLGTKDPPNVKEIRKSLTRRHSLIRYYPSMHHDDSSDQTSEPAAHPAPSQQQQHQPSPSTSYPVALYGASGSNLSHLQRPGYFASPYLAKLQSSSAIPAYMKPGTAPSGPHPVAEEPCAPPHPDPSPSAPPLPEYHPLTHHHPIRLPDQPAPAVYPPAQAPGYYPGQSNSHNPNFPTT